MFEKVIILILLIDYIKCFPEYQDSIDNKVDTKSPSFKFRSLANRFFSSNDPLQNLEDDNKIEKETKMNPILNELKRKLDFILQTNEEKSTKDQSIEDVLSNRKFLQWLKLTLNKMTSNEDDKTTKDLREKINSFLSITDNKKPLSKIQLRDLLLNFAKLLFHKKVEKPISKNVRAPFCRPGQDCFQDVNHQTLANDIKKLAFILSDYLKERVQENQFSNNNGEPSKMDTILTQTIVSLAKIHRSVLRNWHHLTLLLQNFLKPSKNELNNDYLDDFKWTIKCSTFLKGSGINSDSPSSDLCNQKEWESNQICTSPFKSPATDCSPNESHKYFKVLSNQSALLVGKTGFWDYEILISSITKPKNQSEKFISIMGSFDRIRDGEIKQIMGINSLMNFNHKHDSNKGIINTSKLSGRGYFHKGDYIMLRIAKPLHDVIIELSLKYQ